MQVHDQTHAVQCGGFQEFGANVAGQQRFVFLHPFQEGVDGCHLYADTDSAGCLRTRKSTSRGCLLVDKPLIKL